MANRFKDPFRQKGRAALSENASAPAEPTPAETQEPVLRPVAIDFESRETLAEDGQPAVVTRSTRLEGNLSSRSRIILEGEVAGDVDSKKEVHVSGFIQGSVSCQSCLVEGRGVEGDVTAQEAITVEEGSRVTGNLSAPTVTVKGSVAGNILCCRQIAVAKSGSVMGDMSASSISIEPGALVRGAVAVIPEELSGSL